MSTPERSDEELKELRNRVAEAIRRSDFREWDLRRSYTAADEVMSELSDRLTGEEVRREILGDDLNPSALVLDAQAYRRLRETITATMDDPDRWDQDAAEESILSEYVQWLADGRPARDDGWDEEAEPTHLGPDPSHGGLTTHRGRRENCSGPDCGPVDEDAAPQHLSEAERAMLRYALDLAQEKIWSEDGFTDADQDAVASLKRLAGEAESND